MANKNSTKRNFLASLAATGLSVSMLVGTTFAWFTDSVTSSNNIIKTGTLKVSMQYNDDCGDVWNDASVGSIFNVENWQPGVPVVKYVKIANEGTLDLKYSVSIIPQIAAEAGAVSLADVVDVYYLDRGPLEDAEALDEAEFATFETSTNDVGTVTYVMENGLFNDQELAAGEDIVYAILLHMDGANVGNKYQNLSVGEGFTVQLLATQALPEAEYDATQAAPVASVTKREDLINPSTPIVNNSSSIVNGSNSAFIYTGEIELDTAYDFSTPVEVPVDATSKEKEAIKEEIIETNPYARWHADYVVSFSRDVGAGEVALAGNYGDYGWIAFQSVDIDDTDSVNGIPANMEIRMLKGILGVDMSYAEVCVDVQDFICGAWDLTGNNAGLTIKVELRLYEVEYDEERNSWNTENGNSIVIGSFSYTF